MGERDSRNWHGIGLAAGLVAIVAAAGGVVLFHDRPGHAATEATVAAAPAPDPLDLVRWSPADLAALARAAASSASEGLRPEDYNAAALASAVTSKRTGPQTDALAERAARALAHDYADGRVANPDALGWHITHPPTPAATLDAGIAHALAEGQLQQWLESLLPHDPRYAALRAALGQSPDPASTVALRAAMERWRLMPRDLGQRYLFVNIPAYQVTLWENGAASETHKVVVGKSGTLTPVIAATMLSIVVNPSWVLPPSVLKEGKIHPGARGYVFTREGGRLRVIQRPGPNNALGRIKFNLPNRYSVYLHDTPARWAFGRDDRALSHGCVRVEGIEALAKRIGNADLIDAALATTKTKTLRLAQDVPVYLAYFTADPDADGTIRYYPDIYGRDESLIAAMDGKAPDSPDR